MDMTNFKKITLGLIAIVLLATVAYIYSAPQVTTPAESLIASAERLQQLVYCRNQVLQNFSQNSQLFTQIINLTATGDNYLAKAKQSLNLGNVAQAMQYAVLALRTYGQALDLQEQLREVLGASFASCRAVLAPEQANLTANLYRSRVRNETCRWSPDFYPLMTAINVSLQRIRELEGIASKAAENGYDVSNATLQLSQAEQLLAEAQSLAVKCLISESAKKLAEAKKLIGQASSELAKVGAMRVVAEMRRYGLEVNKTHVGEVTRALRAGIFEEYLLKKTLDTLLNVTSHAQALGKEKNRLQLMEQLLDRIQEKAAGLRKQLSLRIRELVREAIALAEKAPEIAKSSPEELSKRAQDIGTKARETLKGGGH
jgi:hypothetical protein